MTKDEISKLYTPETNSEVSYGLYMTSDGAVRLVSDELPRSLERRLAAATMALEEFQKEADLLRTECWNEAGVRSIAWLQKTCSETLAAIRGDK